MIVVISLLILISEMCFSSDVYHVMIFIHLISAVVYQVIQLSYIYSYSCYCFMHCFYARAVPFYTHTLTMVAFWRPWICTSRYWTVCRCSLRLYASTNSWSFFLFSSGTFIFLPFVLFPISRYIRSVLISVIILALDSYDIMRGCLYVVLQYSCFISVRYIACFRLLKA